MLSICCKQLLKKCSPVSSATHFARKISASYGSSRRVFLASQFSSSTIDANDKVSLNALPGHLHADEVEDSVVTEDSEDDLFEASVIGLSEDDALEAKRRYYAQKVSGRGGEMDDNEDTIYTPLREQEIDEFGRSYGTGKRKTSVARVWIKDGSGVFIINERRLIDYFPPIQRESCLGSFVASKTVGLFDVHCTVKGGGQSGQAGAIRLGIARALEAFDPNLRQLLAPAGMLTRDSRRVERKKPGQKKARKQFQWVKR